MKSNHCRFSITNLRSYLEKQWEFDRLLFVDKSAAISFIVFFLAAQLEIENPDFIIQLFLKPDSCITDFLVLFFFFFPKSEVDIPNDIIYVVLSICFTDSVVSITGNGEFI